MGALPSGGDGPTNPNLVDHGKAERPVFGLTVTSLEVALYRMPLTRPLLRETLKLRSVGAGLLPPLRAPHFFTDDRNRTHPRGYEISQLGPPRLVAAEKSDQRGRPARL